MYGPPLIENPALDRLGYVPLGPEPEVAIEIGTLNSSPLTVIGAE